MTDSERKDDDANFRVPIPPTRSYTVPLATLSQPEENVREESRRILEKLLQRDLHKRRGENGGEGSKRDDFKKPFASQPTSKSFDSKCQDGHVAAIRFESVAVSSKTDFGNGIAIGEPKRQISLEIKSSQSTCSSYEEPKRGMATDVDSQRHPSSNLCGSSLSSSSISEEEKDSRSKKTVENKKKKSLFRRAKERLERTLSLRRRRAEEIAEKKDKKVKAPLNSFSTTNSKRRWVRSPENEEATPVPVQRSNSEESTPATERHFRLKFARMSVSTHPNGDGKTTKRRKPANGSASKKTSDFLTPPDSGFRSAKKRRKREDGFQDSTPSRVGEAISNGMKLLKKHSSSSSGCSPGRWLKRKTADRSKSQKEEKAAQIFGNGLELLASTSTTPFPTSTGILHRVSGDYEEQLKRLADTNVVGIQIEPATTSSSEPQSSLSPCSVGDGSQPESTGLVASGGLPGSSQSSQDRRSDDMEEKYALIAQRLADLGDAFLALKWSQLREPSEDEGGTGTEASTSKPNRDHLSSIEREVVEFINSCDQNMQSSEVQFQKNIVLELVGSGNAQQFGRILNAISAPGALDSELMSWTRLAIIFHLTTAAVRAVGASTNAARRLVDYCCDYVTCTFSGWIIGQGGWSSVVEDQSSSEDDRSKKKDCK